MISRLFLFCFLPLVGLAATRVELNFDRSIPAVSFAAAEIERAAALAPAGAPLRVSVEIAPAANRDPQAYRIERSAPDRLRVVGQGPQGAMYGGLDIAEAIRTGTHRFFEGLPTTRPHIARRGIKFNIPLDLRTPELHGLLRRRAGQHPGDVGARVLDRVSSMRWRGTATTCFRFGASIPSPRW